MAWMYAGHCATRCGLKEHASRSSSRFGARVASLARREGANNRGLTSSHDRDVWWFRRGRNVSSLARRAASDASTRFVAAWRRAASMRDCASAVRAGRAFALAVTSGLRVVHRSLRATSSRLPLAGERSPAVRRVDVISAVLESRRRRPAMDTGHPSTPSPRRSKTDTGPAPERLARPRRVGRVLRVRF